MKTQIIPNIKIDKENNFTLVRYFLAINVFINHFNFLNQTDIPRLTFGFINIGAFFCLSGFFAFITYKEGMSLWTFLKKRAKRLIPPYATIVILSAILLSFTSSLNLKDYFISPIFWKYIFANLCYLNFLQPSLPGVFDSNFINAVNGSLWYMKVEWLLTLSVPFTVWISKFSKIRISKIIISAIIFSIIYRLYFDYLVYKGKMDWSNAYRIMKQFPGSIIYFYSGTILYLYYPRIKQNAAKFLCFSCLICCLAYFAPFSETFLTPFATCSLVIWFCIIGKWGYKITHNLNISYGLYLTHFPIIQTFVYLQHYNNWPIFESFSFSIISTWIFSYCLYIIFKPNKKNTP